MTSPEVQERARLRVALTVLALSVAIVIIAGTAGVDGLGVDGLVCLAAIPLAALLVHRSSPAGLVSWLMTPAGALIFFLWVSVLSVPILWAVGLATTWTDYPKEYSTWIVIVAIGAVALIHVGSLMSGTASRPTTPMAWRNRLGLSRVLVLALAVIVVCFAILEFKVGILFLVSNLLTKRDILEGLGPLTAVAASTGVAGLAAWATRDLTLRERLLASACSLGYLAYLFVLGSRLPMIAYVIAIAISRASATRIPRLLLAVLGVGVVPFAVWYSVDIRKGQILSLSESSWRASIRTVLDPFVYGGMDVLHTFGAVITSTLANLSVNVELLLANATTMLPRSLWPEKPPGVSVVFSEKFFERQWLDGSGVPPSIIAELFFGFGVLGGLIAMPILGALLTKISVMLGRSRLPFMKLIYPFATVDCIVLAKSGTDAMLQQLSIHTAAVLMFLVLATFVDAGPNLSVEELDEAPAA